MRWRAGLAEHGGSAATVTGLLSGIPFGVGAWLPGAVFVITAVVLLVLQETFRRKAIAASRERLGLILDPVKAAVRIEGMLTLIGEAASLAPPWRVSLYAVEGAHWTRLARASSYPVYSSSGRPSFAVGEGVATWALRSGGSDSLPVLPDPELDADNYVRVQAGRAVPEDTVRGLKMKSRSYAALALHLTDAASSHSYVALVVESEREAGTDLGRLERVVSKPLIVALVQMASSHTAMSSAESELGAMVKSEGGSAGPK